MISFTLKQHPFRPDQKIVEIYEGEQLLGAIFPSKKPETPMIHIQSKIMSGIVHWSEHPVENSITITFDPKTSPGRKVDSGGLTAKEKSLFSSFFPPEETE